MKQTRTNKVRGIYKNAMTEVKKVIALNNEQDGVKLHLLRSILHEAQSDVMDIKWDSRGNPHIETYTYSVEKDANILENNFKGISKKSIAKKFSTKK